MDIEKAPSARFVERRKRASSAKHTSIKNQKYQKRQKSPSLDDAEANQALLLLLQALSELDQAEEAEAKLNAEPLTFSPDDFSRNDIVQAIELFFKTIASNNACSMATKVLIEHLRTPVMASSLQNGRFLTDARHPARRLIKAIYAKTSAIDSDKFESDACYRAILAVVENLGRDFESDDRLFLQAYFEISHML